jgi:hypothetical protein
VSATPELQEPTVVALRFDDIQVNPNDVVEVCWSNGVSRFRMTDNTIISVYDPRGIAEQAVKMFRYRELDCEISFGCWGVTVTTGNQANCFDDLVGAADQIAILQKRIK